MTTALDLLLLHAHAKGEVVLCVPPDGFELVPAPSEGAEPVPYTLDEEGMP